jgi:hypothetical protein
MVDGDHHGWVPFGDRPTQQLHPDTAAQLLRLFCERHRAMFGALLAEALTGEPPKIRRGR